MQNPLVIGYINKNIKDNFLVSNVNNNLKLDGSFLQVAKIPLNYVSCNISFDIHIINQLDEHFICNLNFPLYLKDDTSSIYDGSFYYELKNIENSSFYRIS